MGSTHIASGAHTAITSAENLSLASGDSLFASIRNTIRLFVYKAGMKMIAAAGNVDIQALSDGINMLAKLDIRQTANRILITAKEEVIINGAGSYLKFSANGIEQGTTGTHVSHASTHSFVGPKAIIASASMAQSLDEEESEIVEEFYSFLDENHFPVDGYNYKIESSDGKTKGKVGATGETERVAPGSKLIAWLDPRGVGEHR
jgi:type VI secretion system secreted protein VgrG